MTREEFVNYAAERAWEVLPPHGEPPEHERIYLLARSVRVGQKRWAMSWPMSLMHLDCLERDGMLQVEFDRIERQWQLGIRAALDRRPSNLDTAPARV